jgi:hypothetical protein
MRTSNTTGCHTILGNTFNTIGNIHGNPVVVHSYYNDIQYNTIMSIHNSTQLLSSGTQPLLVAHNY